MQNLMDYSIILLYTLGKPHAWILPEMPEHNMASVSLFTAVHVHITLRNCMLKRNCATNIVATH